MNDFLNKNGLKDIFLTADVDWAPDFCIENLFELVNKYGLKLTVFATHSSELLKNPPDFIEVGIHPNFLKTDYESIKKTTNKLLQIYPNSLGSRSHRNIFGHSIAKVLSEFGLAYDVSNLLWNQSILGIVNDPNELKRISYFWEDGIHLEYQIPLDWSLINLNSPGIKIINVHPVLIYLNCISDQQRKNLVKNYSDLTKASKTDFLNAKYNKYGISNLWEELLFKIKKEKVKSRFISEILSIPE